MTNQEWLRLQEGDYVYIPPGGSCNSRGTTWLKCTVLTRGQFRTSYHLVPHASCGDENIQMYLFVTPLNRPHHGGIYLCPYECEKFPPAFPNRWMSCWLKTNM